ncbi:MAG: VapC toxin family PIN domain ribonuclease [Spirochaetaceae bacterium]|nr:VapC toxin family PIN domain ribonuclease [Spirochaetaceae bacterium]|tara:strand:+ start:279467 stop:279814 length:348 start_codon:yes stop_codon:yes gene_type:complete
MILVDTSAFVEFFRGNSVVRGLQHSIEQDDVVLHSLVELELALGGVKPEIAELLQVLARCESIPDATLREFIGRRNLAGQGIGYVDCQILAACLANGYRLWTMDKKLDRLWKAMV